MTQEIPASVLTHQATSGEEVIWSAVLGWLVAKVMQWAKGKPWIPFVTVDGERTNRYVSWIAAGAVSMGIAFTYDSVTGDWALRGNLETMMTGVAHFVRQVMFQEIAYKQFVRPEADRKAVSENVGPVAVVETAIPMPLHQHGDAR